MNPRTAPVSNVVTMYAIKAVIARTSNGVGILGLSGVDLSDREPNF